RSALFARDRRGRCRALPDARAAREPAAALSGSAAAGRARRCVVGLSDDRVRALLRPDGARLPHGSRAAGGRSAASAHGPHRLRVPRVRPHRPGDPRARWRGRAAARAGRLTVRGGSRYAEPMSEVIELLQQARLMAIVQAPRREDLIARAVAAAKGALSLLALPVSVPFVAEIAAEAADAADGVTVGLSDVLHAEHVSLALAAGA